MKVLLIGSSRAGSIGLRTIIQESEALSLAVEVSDGPSIVGAAKAHRPHCALLATDRLSDVVFQSLRGLSVAYPDLPLVVCSDERDRTALMAAVDVPVLGILMGPDVSASSLRRTIYLAVQGVHVLSASVINVLVAGRQLREAIPKLTETEEIVLRGLEEDLGAKEIARRLHRDERSVLRIRRKVEDKLGVRGLYKLGKCIQALEIDSSILVSEADD